LGSQKSILIVEDDADLRQMYRVALSLSGYEVHEAADGLEALQVIDGSAFDLVVLDLGLPHYSGAIVREEIAAGALTRHIPVVVVTASPDPGNLNVPCVLQKPVYPAQLIAAVRRCLLEGSDASALQG
jgi:CheY-like chemotaxis protein